VVLALQLTVVVFVARRYGFEVPRKISPPLFQLRSRLRKHVVFLSPSCPAQRLPHMTRRRNDVVRQLGQGTGCRGYHLFHGVCRNVGGGDRLEVSGGKHVIQQKGTVPVLA
jgi:hypothetical protein